MRLVPDGEIMADALLKGNIQYSNVVRKSFTILLSSALRVNCTFNNVVRTKSVTREDV